MANLQGLRFNPFNNLGIQDNISNPFLLDSQEQKQSVPTVAEEYLNKPKSPLQQAISLNWNKSTNEENFTDNKPENEPVGNWGKEYEDWNKGFSNLDETEKNAWMSRNAAKIAGKSDAWIERLWKNQKFAEGFGMEALQMHTPEERDRMYEEALTNAAFGEKFNKNSNFASLDNLTTQGKKELLEAGYKTDKQLQDDYEEFNKKEQKGYSFKDRFEASNELGKTFAASGATIGTTVGGLIGTVFGSVAGSIGGTILGGIIGAGLGDAAGVWTGMLAPSVAKGQLANKRKKDNDEILNKVLNADNERVKEESTDDINALQGSFIEAYNAGRLSEDQINDMFDEIALNGKRTSVDELGNSDTYDYQGSNYYTMFKDTDIFENFDVEDKIKYIAQTQVLANKYGMTKALSTLEQDMQNYVSDNQTAWDWAGNTAWSIYTGGVANLANNLVGLGALAARVSYGDEGLANYLQGKDASGNGESNSPLFDPSYWEKVDKYNTFKRRNHAKADANGGIGVHTNIVRSGDEGKFASWATVNEALKMSKFAWSDLIKVRGLGKLANLASRGAGGIASVAGASEQTVVNTMKGMEKLGAIGTLASSSIGIDVAYGMQTFNDVLQSNNQKLDAIIEKDANLAVQERLKDPQVMADFQRFVKEENNRRMLQAGERGNWIPVDEQKAMQDYVTYLTKQEREKQEQLHAEDRQEALNDAADAYVTDATVEFLRMSATNASFKNYLFDKGTLRALKANNPFLQTTTKDGAYAIGKYAKQKYIAGNLAANIYGGFHSNYFDDVTVGLAKAFELQDYNNYLLDKYNPATYGSVLDNYVNPFIAGMSGTADAMVDPRSFYDGAIGALGAPVSVGINFAGLAHPKAAFKEMADRIEQDKKAGIETDGISWSEYVSHFINSPVIEAIANAQEVERATKREIATKNKILKENKAAFEDMGGTIAALNQKDAVRSGQSVLEAEDAKNKQAFNLAQSLYNMRNSSIVAAATEEVDKTGWSKKKKFASAMAEVFNALIGRDMFPTAESSYTRAMQTLEDAASLGNEDVDTETARRQEDLIKTFLGREENQNTIKDMSDEEKQAFAVERLQKNAQSLLSMIEKMQRVRNSFDKSVSTFGPKVKDQLIYQYVMSDTWEERANELDSRFTSVGEVDAESVADIQSEQGMSIAAKYGSKAAFDRSLKSQENRVASSEAALEKAKQRLSAFRDNPNLSQEENDMRLTLMQLEHTKAQEDVKMEKAALKEIKKEETYFSNTKEVPVISARNILGLNAKDRYRMLDDYHREDYSTEQQREIDKAKAMMTKDGTPITDVMQWAQDAATLRQRIEDNARVADRIIKNPIAAQALQTAAEQNRKQAIFDYFNDKIVARAFQEIQSNPETLLHEDRVAAKAREYSSAVLNGISRMLNATKKSTADDRLDDKTINILEHGINKVLNERNEQKNDNKEFASYLNKTDKVENTYTTPENTQVTTEVNLSKNDKDLIGTLLDYAGEKGVPLDRAAELAGTEGFQRYFEEVNHRKTLDQRMAPASSDYIANLFDDARRAYDKYKEENKKAEEPKQTNNTAESVVTVPVETTPAKEEAPETKPEPAPEGEVSNDEIVDKVENSPDNASIAAEVKALLEEVDKIDNEKLDQEGKDLVKEIIDELLSRKSYNNIKDLQNDLAVEGIGYSEEINDAADLLSKKVIKVKPPQQQITEKDNTETQKQEEKEKDSTKNNELSSMNLDVFLTNPKYKVLADFIKAHNIVPMLQKIAQLWKTSKDFRDTPLVHFIYDPKLASDVQKSIEDSGGEYDAVNSSPIIMALQVTEENRKELFGDQNLDEVEGLIKIPSFKDSDNGKPWYFQPIGIMPATDNKVEEYASTASKMGKLRAAIDSSASQPHLLRHMNDAGTRRNGSAIRTRLKSIENHVDNVEIVTRDQAPRDALELLTENANNPAESIVENVTEEELNTFNQSRASWYESPKEETFKEFKNSILYGKLKEAFLSRIFKHKFTTSNAFGIKPEKSIFKFMVGKNTKEDNSGLDIYVKPIGQTTHRYYPDMTIQSLLEAVTDSTDAGYNDAVKALAHSNSRMERLFNALHDDKMQLQEGEDAKQTLENNIKVILSNFLNIPDLRVSVNTQEMKFGNIPKVFVAAEIFSGNNSLATLRYNINSKPGYGEIATMLRYLILDTNGNIRQNTNKPGNELIKWQVDYNEKERAAEGNKVAKNTLEDLFDDGILTVKANKLAYPANKVTVEIGGSMSKLYNTKTPAPEVIQKSATGDNAAHIGTTKTGEKIDPNTGMKFSEERPSEEDAKPVDIPENVEKAINAIINMSQDRNLTDDEKHYSIGGQLWARITSVKHAVKGFLKGRFNKTNAYGTPATLLGNSFDEFSRDVFNGVFDSIGENLSPSEREALLKKAFEGYSNSTADNYLKVYTKLKEFEASLQGKRLVKTGKNIGTDQYSPGKITVKGILNAKTKEGKTKHVRVAGTIDALAINSDGNLEMYDFKTHVRQVFDEAYAKESGYDIQQSLYAAFLEQELAEMGITNRLGQPVKVVGINLLPAKVKYETPQGLDNDENVITGAVHEYKASERIPNQMIYRKANSSESTPFEEYHAASFQVEPVIPLTRLTDEQLELVYDKMTEEERQAILEEVQDQTQANAEVPKSTKDIEVKPETRQEEMSEMDSIMKPKKKFTFTKPPVLPNRSQVKPISDGQAGHNIDSEGSLQEKINKHKEEC